MIAFGIILYLRLAAIISLTDPNNYIEDYTTQWVEVAPWLFVGVAIVVVVVCGVGLVAAKGSKNAIRMYAAGLILTALAIIINASLVSSFVETTVTHQYIGNLTEDAFLHTKISGPVKDQFSLIESANHCCGAEGPKQYSELGSGYSVFPASCCIKGEVDCSLTDPDVNKKKGCSEIVALKIEHGYKYMTYGSYTFAALEMIGAIWALMLSMKCGHKKIIDSPLECKKMIS